MAIGGMSVNRIHNLELKLKDLFNHVRENPTINDIDLLKVFQIR